MTYLCASVPCGLDRALVCAENATGFYEYTMCTRGQPLQGRSFEDFSRQLEDGMRAAAAAAKDTSDAMEPSQDRSLADEAEMVLQLLEQSGQGQFQ